MTVAPAAPDDPGDGVGVELDEQEPFDDEGHPTEVVGYLAFD